MAAVSLLRLTGSPLDGLSAGFSFVPMCAACHVHPLPRIMTYASCSTRAVRGHAVAPRLMLCIRAMLSVTTSTADSFGVVIIPCLTAIASR